jgi:hypothetical protein
MESLALFACAEILISNESTVAILDTPLSIKKYGGTP